MFCALELSETVYACTVIIKKPLKGFSSSSPKWNVNTVVVSDVIVVKVIDLDKIFCSLLFMPSIVLFSISILIG